MRHRRRPQSRLRLPRAVPAATPAATRGPQSAAVASETLSGARDTPAGLILPGLFLVSVNDSCSGCRPPPLGSGDWDDEAARRSCSSRGGLRATSYCASGVGLFGGGSI